MSDRDIVNWDKRLSDQESRGWENYLRRRIHLDKAKDLELFSIAGEFIYVEDVSSRSASASIRLNRNMNDPIDLEIATVIKTIFTQAYITHEAQEDEWIDIVWGINFEYYKQKSYRQGEAQPCFVVTNALADTNTVAAAHVCDAALIRALTTNAGLVWVNFGAPATDGGCYPLDKGDVVAVPCNNTNRINALFKVANEKIVVTYRV